MFIDEIHTLAQVGSDKGETNPADMLKPYLARGEMQTIGATTTDEYRKYIEKDKALERRFQPIMVDQPTVEQTIEILCGLRETYEKYHKVIVPLRAKFENERSQMRFIVYVCWIISSLIMLKIFFYFWLAICFFKIIHRYIVHLIDTKRIISFLDL